MNFKLNVDMRDTKRLEASAADADVPGISLVICFDAAASCLLQNNP